MKVQIEPEHLTTFQMAMKKRPSVILFVPFWKTPFSTFWYKFEYVWSQILQLTDFQSNKWNSPIRLTFSIVHEFLFFRYCCYSDYGTICLNTLSCHSVKAKEKLLLWNFDFDEIFTVSMNKLQTKSINSNDHMKNR